MPEARDAAPDPASTIEALRAEVRRLRGERDGALGQLARAQALVDRVPAGVFLKDAESRIIYVNSYMRQHLGQGEWEGKTPWEVYPGELAARIVADDQRALEEGPQTVREWVPAHDGVERYFETRKFPVDLPDGTRLLGGVAVDITETKRAHEGLSRQREHLEELVARRTADLQAANRALQSEMAGRAQREQQLRAQWERFAVILEHFPELVYVVDPSNQKLLFVNRRLRDLLGFDPLGRACHEALHGLDVPCRGCSDPLLLPERGALTWEQDSERLGRSYLMVDQVVPWPDGRQVRFEVAVDITRRRRAEQALQQKASELERSRNDLRELTYVSSHHLQSPLRSVRGFLQLLRRQCEPQLDARGLEFLGIAEEAAGVMTALVTDLEEYLRVERSELQVRIVDVDQTLNLALQRLQPTIDARGAQVERGPLPRLRVHAGQLFGLLVHLLDNALEFGGHNARVRVWAEPLEPGWWELGVDDNGPGVPRAHREKVFRLFAQLEPGRTGRGTGLGLAICRRIVANHGGTIRIEDAPGGGCRVRFALPEANASPLPAHRPAPLQTPSPRLKTELPTGQFGFFRKEVEETRPKLPLVEEEQELPEDPRPHEA